VYTWIERSVSGSILLNGEPVKDKFVPDLMEVDAKVINDTIVGNRHAKWKLKVYGRVFFIVDQIREDIHRAIRK